MAEIIPDEGLDWLLGQWPRAASAQSTCTWMGLFTSQTASAVAARGATMAASIVEVTGSAYVRVSLAASDWGAPATSGNGRKSTHSQKTFPTATGNWTGPINGYFVTTASTGND